jgi:peptidoglycan hydrolase-like protein with peptidoglycan-binding domain
VHDDGQPGRGAGGWAQRLAWVVTGRGGNGGRGRPRVRRVGLGLATLLTSALVAGTGGLAYLAVSSATASGHGAANRAHHGARQAPAVAGPLRVMSFTPSAGSVGVTGATTLQVTFSAPIAANSAMPELTPATGGQWLISGNVLTFTPDTAFAPATLFTLRIAAGASGPRSVTGSQLARPVVVRFRTERYSPLRLAQLLGELGYLPLSWQLDSRGHVLPGQAGAGLAAQQSMAYSPPPGTFTWNSGYPATLRSQWQPGRPGPLIRGAVMAFQAQHGLTINGVASDALWRALFAAADGEQRNAVGYTYAIASKGSPGRLTIWHDGQVVLRSLANTGIAVAPTASGTYAVYLRLWNMIMSGTNPDGSHYRDPVGFVACFNGGDAVGHVPRGSYGWPQSLGCVELPYQNAAARAWPFLTYGSLVTVTG